MQGYKYHPLCKVCTAYDRRGQPLREEVDNMIAQSIKNVEVIKFLAQNGVFVTERNFSRHLHNHSPFTLSARQTRSDKAIHLKHKAEIEQRDAQESLKKIIAIGDTMIDNWWNELEGPKMPVSEKLYIEAVKEEGRRAPRTQIDIELDMMEKEFIEGQNKDG